VRTCQALTVNMRLGCMLVELVFVIWHRGLNQGCLGMLHVLSWLMVVPAHCQWALAGPTSFRLLGSSRPVVLPRHFMFTWRTCKRYCQVVAALCTLSRPHACVHQSGGLCIPSYMRCWNVDALGGTGNDWCTVAACACWCTPTQFHRQQCRL
jgi:hypothetical protein